jgi:hypothetical protein
LANFDLADFSSEIRDVIADRFVEGEVSLEVDPTGWTVYLG